MSAVVGERVHVIGGVVNVVAGVLRLLNVPRAKLGQLYTGFNRNVNIMSVGNII